MLKTATKVLVKFKDASLDLFPIILVVIFFQSVIIRQPFPDVMDIIIGVLMVILGLMFFVQGLEMGLFPIGENLSYSLIKRGSAFWLFTFAFLLGFSTTIAEPALIAITKEAASVAINSGLLEKEMELYYSIGLRISVAFSVGLAVLIGVLRIIKGWPIYYLIVGGYILVMVMTLFAPEEIIGIAYDAGGVTTSTITVPLVTALGVGLATVIKGRSPLTDGFGLIAFASLLPMVFVMLLGLFFF